MTRKRKKKKKKGGRERGVDNKSVLRMVDFKV